MLGRFLKLFERKSANGYAALLGVGAATAANIAVTPERALKCAPVYRGVSVRCEVLGSLPLHLYERRDDGGKDRATNHPLYRLIHDRPNPWTSAAEFVMQLEQDGITDGGGYALANRAGDKIVELIRLPPRSVCVELDDKTLEPKYQVTLKNGTKKTYPWQDILHVPVLGNLAPIKQAREAIGLCLAMELHAGLLFGNGARPSGILKYKGALTQVSAERLKHSWSQGHAGAASGRTAILENGIEFDPLTFNSVDLQFQELRMFQVIEIARALGVPPSLLFDYGRATWGNAEQMAQSFLSFTILPRLKLWQGAVSRLLPADEQEKYVPEFLVDELVKAEIAARFEAYAKAITNGVLNPNEARAMENRPPYAGGEQFRVPMNTETPGSPAAANPRAQAKPRIAA